MVLSPSKRSQGVRGPSQQRYLVGLILAGLAISVIINIGNFRKGRRQHDILQCAPTTSNMKHDASSSTKPYNNDPAFEMNILPAPDYHIVVSTGCSTYQDWQSYVLFFHAMKSGQVTLSSNNDGSISYVTRVVSGCNASQAEKMNEIHNRDIAPIAPGRFFIHHTPDYTFKVPNVNYKFFNKAYGYQHWLVHVLRYPYNHKKYDDVTYILMDPDQIILRPFVNNYTQENELWGAPLRDKRVVERGQPFAQEYAMGIAFLMQLKSKMHLIAPLNELPSPVQNLSRHDALAYQVGPPYIMKGYDLWRLVNKWVDFAPSVFTATTNHVSEMYAYSAAAAHLQLPHATAQSFMVSNADVLHGEGWQLIENEAKEDVCANIPVEKMPHVIHYCQEYGIGTHYFSKYSFPENFISCESPLLKSPPPDVAAQYNYMINSNKQRRNFESDNLAKRMTFAVCYMIKSLNEAAVYYKEQNCDPTTANFNRTLVFAGNHKWTS